MIATIQIKKNMCTPTGLFYVLPDNPANVSCPSQPCVTLSQYLRNMSGMSNVKFLFLSGEHSLTSNITMNHVRNVTMIGINNDNLGPPSIFCYSPEAVITFSNSVKITISNLAFKNCGGLGPTIMPWYNPVHPDDYSKLAAALFFNTCYYCTVTNTTFMGYGLMANNLLGECHLDNISLHLHTVSHGLSYWCNQGIKLINIGKITKYIRNLIYVSKIKINGSGNNCQSAYQYDIGMRFDLEPTNYDITLVLSDSDFHNVNVQPVLQIGLFHGVSSRVMLWVKNCKFQHNNYTTVASAIKLSAINIAISCINVTLYFTSCTFYKNENAKELSMISIGVLEDDVVLMEAYPGDFNEPYILPVNWCLFPSYVRIVSSSFIGNRGTLIDMQGMEISGCVPRFSIIGTFNLLRNWGDHNIISIYHAVVNIIGEANFSFNLGAKNIILFYECMVIFRKNVSFIENGYAAAVSQIITLQSDLAYIK